MRGAVHSIRIYGLRETLGASPTFEPVRDSEGRFVRSPTNPPYNTPVTTVTGFVGYTSTYHMRGIAIPEGETVDTAAHLPRGTVIHRGDELEAYNIPAPDTALNGRYRIVGVSYGRVMVRVAMRRYVA